jgi:hypothetical protein
MVGYEADYEPRGEDVNLRRVVPVVVVVLAVVATGCGSSKKSSSSASTTPKTGPKYSVAFVKPKPNSTATGGKVTATVKLTNFTLDPQDVGKAPKPGKGHLHFSMDGGKYDFPKYSGPNGDLAKKLGVTGKYSPSVTPSITYKGLPKGKHTISVQLANNDHSNAGGAAQVSFTVK